jgi:hypothetical protein
MPHIMKLLLAVLIHSLQSRRDLLLENLALRQQLAALARHRPSSGYPSIMTSSFLAQP